MNKHTLTLMGGLHGELRVPAHVLLEAVGALVEGARRATRFAVEGQSVRKGRRPSWLDAVCTIDITGMSAGSAVIEIEAPTVQEAYAAHVGDDGQHAFVGAIDRDFGEQTAVDLFGQALASGIEGDADDVMADRALLDTCVRFARITGGGVEGVRLDGLAGRGEPLIITPGHVPRIEGLREQTPPHQAARVAGTLDTISASISDVTLNLNDGTKIRVRLEDHDAEELKALFGKHVVVSGLARYGPSGRLLSIAGESIGEASAGDSLFEAVPVAQGRLPAAIPVAQDDSSGVSAFFGTWPGDESEGELLDALQAIG
ncbi:MAG: hypothetical protein ABGY41_15420 [Candidatus Poribacteria bacterium]